MLPMFYGEDGPLLLGERVGRGGEGEVFALADGTGRALKIYMKPDATREAKIRAMVAAGLSRACPNVAFPSDMAFKSKGVFAGFTMPLVSNHHAIHELYSPASRRQIYPNGDWRFLVRTAANVARLFAAIHDAGAVVGDINGSGFLVSQRATVAAIDADSFQWGPDHPCRVGVLEFTPPELQGRSLDGVTRTPDHDGFGLATLLFHLLFLGRHPHAGVSVGREVGLGDAIRQGRFAYSRLRDVRMTPPPGTPLLSDLPLGARVLFERAFGMGVGLRPTAVEWVEELDRMSGRLICCARNARHYHAAADGACPWCRIERMEGRPVFGPRCNTDSSTPGFVGRAIRDEVAGSIRRSREIAGEALEPRSRPTNFCPSEDAREFRSRDNGALLFARKLEAALAKGRATDQFTRRYIRSRDQLAGQLDAWRGRVGVWKVNRLAERLADDLDRFERLDAREAIALLAVRGRERQARIRSALSVERVGNCRIPGVGPRRLAALFMDGIVTAADVTGARLSALSSISEAARFALLIWRDEVAVRADRGITYDDDPDTGELDDVRCRFRRAAEEEESALRWAALKLNRLADEIAELAQVRDRDVDSARSLVGQALADLAYLGLPVPGAAVPADCSLPKSKPKPKPKGSKTANGPAGCPLCGGRLVKRWARAGSAPNQFFLGCEHYPKCTGSRPMRRKAKP